MENLAGGGAAGAVAIAGEGGGGGMPVGLTAAIGAASLPGLRQNEGVRAFSQRASNIPIIGGAIGKIGQDPVAGPTMSPAQRAASTMGYNADGSLGGGGAPDAPDAPGGKPGMMGRLGGMAGGLASGFGGALAGAG